MTKRLANKFIKLTFEHIHSIDDLAKAVEIVEKLSVYTKVEQRPRVEKNTDTETANETDQLSQSADNVDNVDNDECHGLFDDEFVTEEQNSIENKEYTQGETKPMPTSVVRRIPSLAEQEADTAMRKSKEDFFQELPPLPERSDAEKVKIQPMPVEPKIDLTDSDSFASFMPPLPKRADNEKKSLEPPTVREAPTDEKLKRLMEAAPNLMSEPAWQTFEAMYRRGQTYEEMRNTWAYFARTQPADWQELPEWAAA